MGYYVATKGRHGLTLFLIDRGVTKSRWWTTDLHDAMTFRKESAASYSANRLRYKQPRVVDEEEANDLDRENMHVLANAEEPI